MFYKIHRVIRYCDMHGISVRCMEKRNAKGSNRNVYSYAFEQERDVWIRDFKDIASFWLFITYRGRDIVSSVAAFGATGVYNRRMENYLWTCEEILPNFAKRPDYFERDAEVLE